MQSTETRYRLRFVMGERQGETVPLHEGVVTIGRRGDNTLVLAHGSVSGHHAEIRVANGRAELSDLGSTNGTKVGGRKVERAALAHGDEVSIGQIKLVFVDAELSDAPAPGAAAAPAADGLESVSVDKVRASGRRSRLGLLALLVVAALAAAAFVWTRRGERAGGGPARAAAVAVEGDLFAGGDFESDEPEHEWRSAEAAPRGFVRERASARTGRFGLGCELAAPEDGGAVEWSLAWSPDLAVGAGRAFALRASARADAGVEYRLGVELLARDAETGGLVWTPARTGGADGFEDVEAVFVPTPGAERLRVVAAARGVGRLSLDDVHVLPVDPPGTSAGFNELELRVLAEPGSTAALLRAGRPVLGRLQLGPWDRRGASGPAGATWRASAADAGFTLSVDGARPDTRLAVVVDDRGLDLGGEDSSWIATSGPAGYRAHALPFERREATAVFLGRGTQLVRLGFATPVDLRGERRRDGPTLTLGLNGNDAVDLQLSFVAERTEATTLAGRAQEADRRGQAGVAIATWSELLARYPIDRAQVTRAEEAIARLTSAGLDEVTQLRAEFERARFFALPELFRQGIERCRALAARYTGSEVRVEAERLEAEIAAALSEARSGGQAREGRLLQGVLQALDPKAQPRLSERVQRALQGRASANDEGAHDGNDHDGNGNNDGQDR